jgi:predicted HicB family RNase H-like nuclease
MTTTHEYRGYDFTIEYQPEDPAFTQLPSSIAQEVVTPHVRRRP